MFSLENELNRQMQLRWEGFECRWEGGWVVSCVQVVDLNRTIFRFIEFPRNNFILVPKRGEGEGKTIPQAGVCFQKARTVY